MKLAREALAHYLDTTWKKKVGEVATAAFEIIGDDIEDMSVNLSPDVSTTKNILGQTKTQDNGYAPTIDADPYYANTDSGLYEHLRDIAMERLKGDDCKTLLLEVIVEDPAAETYLAYVREVIVKPASYGGGTNGVNIPFTITEDGAWEKGSVTAVSVKAGSPVFTKASSLA